MSDGVGRRRCSCRRCFSRRRPSPPNGPRCSQTAPSTAAGPLDAASAAATSFRNAALRFASPITSLASFSEPSLTSASSFGSPPLSDDHDRASLEGWVERAFERRPRPARNLRSQANMPRARPHPTDGEEAPGGRKIASPPNRSCPRRNARGCTKSLKARSTCKRILQKRRAYSGS